MSGGAGRRRRLVLHVDLNNTVVAADAMSGQGPRAALNVFLSTVTWGRAGAAGEWQWASDRPSLGPPCPGAVSYYSRHGRDPAFTEAGPGRCFGGLHARHLQLLEWPGRPHDVFSVPGEPSKHYHLILPAFFRLLDTLHREGRAFAVVFRTFGADLPRALRAVSCALAGQHPRFPALRDVAVSGTPRARRAGEGQPDGLHGAPHVRLLSGRLAVPLLKAPASAERKHSQLLGKKLLAGGERACVRILEGRVSSRAVPGWAEHPFSRRGAAAAERGSLARSRSQPCSALGSTLGRNAGNELQKLLWMFLGALTGNRNKSSVQLPVDLTPGQIRCSKQGAVLTRGAERLATHKDGRKLYDYFSSFEGIGGFQDHFDWWARNQFSSQGGKPLWIDPHDPGVHHIFIDDNIRLDDADTVVHPQVFSEQGSSSPRHAPTSELYDICLVQTDLLEAIADEDYFLRCVRRCEENYDRYLACTEKDTPGQQWDGQ
ncbi:hypothetical protein QYF61_026220 [Mycteria americana]|uniref:Uncharacterized protein n=1 Tax=Mycteria americana TaxID=33587 RepID=A0AAN7RT16_MYCAM|nr:hypothetical protein QYF61_026220 [Mycteria americana]